MRIGIATGVVVAGDIVGQGSSQEQVVVGDTPNLAERLQGLAEPGGVVVSAATRRLLGDRFRLKDLGRHAVKGLAEPVKALRGARRVPEREPFRRGACLAADRLRRSRGRERRTYRAPAQGVGRSRPDRADLGRSGHRQIAPVRLARG